MLSPANPHLLEVAASFPVVQGIDGKNLLPLDGSQSQDGGNLLVPVLELRLVEQYLHIGVVDDSLLDDGRINHVIQFLRNHSGNAVELADGLIKVLDVLRHGGRGNRFPCLFDYQCLASFLDAHLLQEHVHDNQHHDREKHGVILDFVNFKDDKPLVKEVHVQVGVQRGFQLAAPVELFQDGCKVTDVETDFLQRGDLRDALQGKLIVGIEGKLLDLQPPFLFFHVVDLLLYLNQHGIVIQFFLVGLNDAEGTFLLGWGCRLVIHKGGQ